MKISRLRTDQKKEAEGVWVPVGEGLEIRVARIGNPAYEAFLRRETRPVQRAVRAGMADPKAMEEISNRAMARHVLLDWRNLEDEVPDPDAPADKQPATKTVPVPYSEEK